MRLRNPSLACGVQLLQTRALSQHILRRPRRVRALIGWDLRGNSRQREGADVCVREVTIQRAIHRLKQQETHLPGSGWDPVTAAPATLLAIAATRCRLPRPLGRAPAAGRSILFFAHHKKNKRVYRSGNSSQPQKTKGLGAGLKTSKRHMKDRQTRASTCAETPQSALKSRGGGTSKYSTQTSQNTETAAR